MKLFLATSPSIQHLQVLKECEVRSILISYAFIKKPGRLLEIFGDYRPKDLILDSGAFSVWSNGETIKLDDYKAFCLDVKKLLGGETNLKIVNLDVLPGKWGERPTEEQRENSAQQSWNNMLELEAEGLKVINVFHQHEDFKWLEKLRNHSDYIGISPANDVSMPEKLNWLNAVFKRIKNSVKTHGFAVTAAAQVYNYPFYSVDSSSWIAGARYARTPIFRDDLTIGSFSHKNLAEIKKYWDYLKHIGIKELSDDWRGRTKISIKSYQELERIATKLWTSRGIVWND